jgi:predicted GH43/DUF377 family glycosyl hydrolase
MNSAILQDKALIHPSDLQAVCPDYKVIGTFNPAAACYNDEIVLLVRVVEQPCEQEPGRLISPRAERHAGKLRWIIDIFDSSGAETHDPRTFRLPNGDVRLRYISHLRLVRLSSDDLQVREIITHDNLLPKTSWDEMGLEDPRITKIGNTYYITYVAFRRHGIIFPTENKDVVLLPEKRNGHFVAYHRPVSNQLVAAPSIETSLSSDGIFWGQHRFLFRPRPGSWDSARVGSGPPPIRLPQGWLLIYHGIAPATRESPAGRYCAGAVLLDLENPTKLIARSTHPLILPKRPYEQNGFIPNVIFPTGALLNGEDLLLFAGGADEVVSFLRLKIDSVLENLGID